MNDPTADLFQALVSIPQESSEAEALRLMVELANAVIDADESSLLVLERGPDGREELVFLLTDHLGDASASERVLQGQRVPLGEGLTGMAAITGEAQIGSPVFTDIEQPGPEEPKMVLAVPMFSKEKLIGVLTAITRRPDRVFTRKDAEVYGKVASVMALVIDQRRRLGMLDGLRSDAPLPPARTPEEDVERRIVALVAGMVRRSPERLTELLALLEAVDRYAQPGVS